MNGFAIYIKQPTMCTWSNLKINHSRGSCHDSCLWILVLFLKTSKLCQLSQGVQTWEAHAQSPGSTDHVLRWHAPSTEIHRVSASVRGPWDNIKQETGPSKGVLHRQKEQQGRYSLWASHLRQRGTSASRECHAMKLSMCVWRQEHLTGKKTRRAC